MAMATGTHFKELARRRLKTAKILLDNEDWQAAAYMMGLALECALKSSICKTLRITDYPEDHKDKKVPDFFMTHSFIRLLLVSGLNDIFDVKGVALAFDNWSAFTARFPGDWTAMRYIDDRQFDAATTRSLFGNIYLDEHSIFKVISKKRRW